MLLGARLCGQRSPVALEELIAGLVLELNSVVVPKPVQIESSPNLVVDDGKVAARYSVGGTEDFGMRLDRRGDQRDVLPVEAEAQKYDAVRLGHRQSHSLERGVVLDLLGEGPQGPRNAGDGLGIRIAERHPRSFAGLPRQSAHSPVRAMDAKPLEDGPELADIGPIVLRQRERQVLLEASVVVEVDYLQIREDSFDLALPNVLGEQLGQRAVPRPDEVGDVQPTRCVDRPECAAALLRLQDGLGYAELSDQFYLGVLEGVDQIVDRDGLLGGPGQLARCLDVLIDRLVQIGVEPRLEGLQKISAATCLTIPVEPEIGEAHDVLQKIGTGREPHFVARARADDQQRSRSEHGELL